MAINLQDRKKWIGASEAAAALGYSAWKTPLDIYREKLGLCAPFEGNAATKRGNRLEPIVAQYFQDEIDLLFKGAKVYTISELHDTFPNFYFPSGCVRTFENGEGTDTFVSATHDFMGSSPDRILVFDVLNDVFGPYKVLDCAGVEIKTANDYNLKTAEDVIEKHQEWLFQCHYNMIVAGLRRWYLVWVNDFNLALNYFVVEYDEELAQEIINETSNFWHNHILAETPPEPQTVEDNNWIHPNPTSDPPLEATHELYQVVLEYNQAKDDEAAAKAKVKKLKDRMACAVGNSTEIFYGGVKIATYRMQMRKDFNIERLKEEMPEVYEQYCLQSPSRVWRRVKPKKEK